MPEFSIIIPVYNVAPNLRECLDSVLESVRRLRSVRGGVEVICVDDGSTDGSGAILDECRERQNVQSPGHPAFRVLHRPNAGVSAARNAALGIAQGEWLCFVDADDVVHADWLERCQRAIGEFPDADMVRFGQIEFDDGERCPWPTDARRDANGVLDLRKRISNDALEGTFCGHIYRRSKVADMRFPSYRVGEDWVWKIEAILRADSLVDAEGVLYGYRQRATSVMHSGRTPEWIRAMLDWPLHVLRAFSDSEKDIDPALIRWFLAGLVTWAEEYCLCGRSNGEEMWSHWCDALVAVSRMRKVPLWFRAIAASVGRMRSRRMACALLVVPRRVRRLSRRVLASVRRRLRDAALSGLHALRGRKYCYLLNRHVGMGNRLITLANQYVWCGKDGLRLCWGLDDWLPEPFENLFQMTDAPDFRVRSVPITDWSRAACLPYPKGHRETWRFYVPVERRPECEGGVIDCLYERTPEWAVKAYGPFFRQLRPSERVWTRIRACAVTRDVVCVQVRNTNRKGEYANVSSIRQIVAKMRKFDQSQRFFVSAVDEGYYREIEREFPGRVFGLPDKDYASMVDTVAEMWLLGQGKELICMGGSTFPEIAWWWGDRLCRVTQLTKEYQCGR